MPYIYLSLAVALNVAAYAIFKSIAPHEHDLGWATLFSLGLAFGAGNLFCFTLALRSLRLSVAYPVFSGGSIVGIAVIAALVFKEHMTTVHVAGAALIMLGIAALSA